MKRFITLALALVIAFGAVSAASAIDIQVKGQWHFGIGWYDNKNFYSGYDEKKGSDDAFNGRHRIRTQIDFIASEQLRGVLMFEIGTLYWGRNGASGTSHGRGAGGALDSDGVNVETKRAFLDWMVPNTDLAIRMGIQLLSLPSATGFGNPIMNSDVAGVTANYKFNDTVSLTAFWARPFDANWNDGGKRSYDELDMLGLMLPINLDGVKFTPWFTYASVGGDSGFWTYRAENNGDANTGNNNDAFNSRENAWWAGLGTEINAFDPLFISFDVMYGRISGDAEGNITRGPWTSSNGESPESKGWFIDALIEYKADWGTPGLFGWYSTGDDYDDIRDGEYGRMPIVGTDMGFGPTVMGTCGGRGWLFDKALTRSGVGLWAIGARIKDISFIDDMKHLVSFTYYRGTNDHDIVKKGGLTRPFNDSTTGGARNNPGLFGESIYMTDKDSAYEINFVTDYKIYDNLTFTLNTGIMWLDLDGDVWSSERTGGGHKDYYGDNTSASYTVECIFVYNF